MTALLDRLANAARLLTFPDATLDLIGRSVGMALASTVEALVRQLFLRSDDLDEAQRLGRVIQVARVPSRPTLRRRLRR
jgi:hypothetical protein